MNRPSSAPRWQWIALAAALAVAGVLIWRFELRPLAVLRDGPGELRLTASGEVEGDPEMSTLDRVLVAEALRSWEMPDPVTPWKAPESSAADAEKSAVIHLLAPAGERVLDDRPRFQWAALPGATSYRVAISDGEQVLQESATLSGVEWRPGDSLPRRRKLAWRVTSAPQGRSAPAYFEIIAAESASRIAAVRARPAPGHLLLAVLYAREDLRRDAAGELAALAARNPASPLVKHLQSSLGAP